MPFRHVLVALPVLALPTVPIVFVAPMGNRADDGVAQVSDSGRAHDITCLGMTWGFR